MTCLKYLGSFWNDSFQVFRKGPTVNTVIDMKSRV